MAEKSHPRDACWSGVTLLFFPLLKSDVINGDDAAANGDNLLKSSLARRRLRFDRHSIASLRIKNDILTVALRASVPESKSQLYQIKFP